MDVGDFEAFERRWKIIADMLEKSAITMKNTKPLLDLFGLEKQEIMSKYRLISPKR